MAQNVAGTLLNSQAQSQAAPPKPVASAGAQGLGGPNVGPGPGTQVVPQANAPQPSQQPPTTPITPQNTLRGQQIGTGPSAQTQQTGQMVQNAAQQVAQAQPAPIARYQAAAAPYQQQGQQLFNQATGAVGQAQQYGQNAAQAIGNTGFGNYGAINPSAGSMTSAQQIGGPTYQQGQIQLPGVQTGPMSGLRDLAFGQDTNALRNQLSGGLNSLYTAPDRGELAAKQFALLQEQAAPQFAQQVRQLGNSTAAFGRMGSGLVNSQLADLGTAAATSRDQNARQLALDAAGQTMQDRLNRVGATQSGLGALAGLDTGLNSSFNDNRLNTYDRNFARDQFANQNALAGANFNAGRDDARNAALFNSQNANANNALQAAGMNNQVAQQLFNNQNTNRNFAFGADQARNSLAFDKANMFRGLGSDALAQGNQSAGLANDAFGRGNTERNFLSQYDQYGNDLAFNKLNSLAGLQGQQFGQDQTTRNNLVGERGYQDDLAQQANADAINQYIQEQAQQNQGFNQWNQGVNTLGNLGYQSDPTQALQFEGTGLANQGNSSINGFAEQLANQLATPSLDQQLRTSTPNIPTWGPQYVSPPLDTSNIPSFGKKG